MADSYECICQPRLRSRANGRALRTPGRVTHALIILEMPRSQRGEYKSSYSPTACSIVFPSCQSREPVSPIAARTAMPTCDTAELEAVTLLRTRQSGVRREPAQIRWRTTAACSRAIPPRRFPLQTTTLVRPGSRPMSESEAGTNKAGPRASLRAGNLRY